MSYINFLEKFIVTYLYNTTEIFEFNIYHIILPLPESKIQSQSVNSLKDLAHSKLVLHFYLVYFILRSFFIQKSSRYHVLVIKYLYQGS